MKEYKDQSEKDRASKVQAFGGGGAPSMKPAKPTDKPTMPGMEAKKKGGSVKSHKPHKPHKLPKPGPSAEALLARPVPAPGPAGPVVAPQPAMPVPAGLGAMQANGGRAHRAAGGRTTKHHMTAGAGSGEGRLEKIGKKP